MSSLQVANIHLEATGNNRIQFLSPNTIQMFAGTTETLAANSIALNVKVPMNISGQTVATDTNVLTLTNKTINASQLINGTITAPKLDGSQTGSAPIYAARVWLTFNGTGSIAIIEDGNVSTLGDNGSGDYTVNFSTALPSANYSVAGAARRSAAGTRGTVVEIHPTVVPTTTELRIRSVSVDTAPTPSDCERISVICIG